MVDDYKDELSKPLYDETKKQIDQASENEIINETKNNKA